MTHPSPHKPDKVRRIIAEAALEEDRGGVVTAPAEALKLLAEPHAKTREAQLKRTLELVDRVGKKELSDLLYEMARACLAADTNFQYSKDDRLITPPDSVEHLVRNATAVAGRINDDRIDWSLLPSNGLPHDAAPLAAEKCLDASDAMINPGLGTRFLRAVLAEHRQSLDEALNSLADLKAEQDIGGWLCHVHAKRIQLLNRARRYEQSLKEGWDSAISYPEDRLILFNMAYAAASLRDISTFNDLCARLSALTSSVEDPTWWTGMSTRHSQWMSLETGLPQSAISEAIAARSQREAP